MFQRLAPQRVQHSSGFIVQIADRETVEYLDGARSARITVDFADLTGVYEDTLTDWSLPEGHCLKMTDAERPMVLRNIGDGLAFMGVRFEWCRSAP